jgi:hypothetical protein
VSADMHVDADELDQFAATLERFDAELSESESKLSSNWSQLGDVWRDEQYEKFAADWEAAVRAIKGYSQRAPGYTKHLRQKVRQVREYLRG